MRAVVVIGFVILAVLTRWIPHPPNFTPILGMALFSGWALSSRSFAILLPLVAMVISDFVLGFHDQMVVVYLAVVMATLIGPVIQRSPFRLMGAAVGASVVFFVVTNFAVWLGGTLYVPTFGGLVECYVAAIPFFGNTLASTVLSSAVLFSAFHFLEQKVSPALASS